MATLNTLRTRGGIIVSVVIGIALLAFLLGDLTSAQGLMNSKKMRVGTINGENIGYIEYLNQTDEVTNVIQSMYGRSGLSSEETDQIRQMVWETMVLDYAYKPGFEKMGLEVGEDEQIDMVNGEYVSAVIQQSCANAESGMYDPQLLKNFVAGLDGSDPVRESIWSYLKQQMVTQRIMDKYLALVTAGVYVNDLQVDQAIQATDLSYGATYATLGFGTVADSLVSISKSDIRKFYDANKEMFRQKASREIEYVVFDLLPSEEDYAAAEKYIGEIAEEFRTAENPMQYATLNSQSQTDTRYYKESELPVEMAAIAFGSKKGEMYGPVLAGDVYTLARVVDVKPMPDTVGARHILLPITDELQADSIVKALKGGADFGTLAAAYSLDPRYDLGHFAPEMMVAPFGETVAAHKPGDIFTVETQFGLHVVEATYVAPKENKAQIATIVYNVEPSDYTQQEVYGRARDFLAKAGKTYESFDNAIAESGLARRSAVIAPQDKNVQGLTNSRELVRWSYTNDQGAVSSILDIDGNYVVAALTKEQEEGIAPLEAVAAQIETRLLNQKKADILMARLDGKTLAEAEAEGATKGVVSDVQFGSFFVPELGVEPRLIGAICSGTGMKKPVKGVSGVFLVDVTGEEKTGEATAESERVRLEAMSTTYLPQRVSQALEEESEIIDNRVKFF